MVELIVPYENKMEEAHIYKREKYMNLTKELENAGYKSVVMPVETVARGFNLKHQKTRREQFSASAVTSTMPPSAYQGHMNGSVLLQDEASHIGNGEIAIDMSGSGKGNLQNQMQIIDEQDAYIQSRADTMQNIESTIVELGSIFQQLAHMVKEQEEIVGRIDHNVDDASQNIEAAHTEILKYFQFIKLRFEMLPGTNHRGIPPIMEYNRKSAAIFSSNKQMQPMHRGEIFHSKNKTKPQQKKENLFIMPPQEEAFATKLPVAWKRKTTAQGGNSNRTHLSHT
ncbi:hypothetical protein RRG08_006496 [Elysia crispata]|uniref:t-SNARE coiled-coil homology domain-containing protein n=1 Tax=Elysia crispata TaxID=231223 RepID=A0AAE0YAL1_9GAST|nr:hypothetical protein RRG08_006496 [Elysia crispata]